MIFNNPLLRKRSGLLLSLAAVACLSGCGGSGTATSAGTYAGTYKGQAIANGSSTVSNYDVTINVLGTVTGLVTTGQSSTTVSGTITPGGLLSVSANGQTFTGILAKPSSTTAGVTLNETGGSNVIYVLFVETPLSPITGTSPYLGQFIGTDTDTSSQSTGPLVFSIDGSGNLSGEILTHNSSDAVVTVDLTGTISSTGAISATGTVNGTQSGTLTGQATLTGNTLTGTLASSDGKNLTFTLTNASPAL